jgi:hypothetical protein
MGTLDRSGQTSHRNVACVQPVLKEATGQGVKVPDIEIIGLAARPR